MIFEATRCYLVEVSSFNKGDDNFVTCRDLSEEVISLCRTFIILTSGVLARKTAKRLEKVNQDLTYATQGSAIGCSVSHGYVNVLIEN